MSIYDAAMKYQAAGVPTVVVAGKEYGTGSSRDWAAKGPRLLGVRAVIAEIVRAHPPLQSRSAWACCRWNSPSGKTRRDYAHHRTRDHRHRRLAGGIKPRMKVTARVTYPDGHTAEMPLAARIDTLDEVAYFKSGGILHHVLRHLLAA